MIFRPFWIVACLTLYFPFEDFLLKWLPVSDTVYSYCRLGGELTIYVVLAVVLFHKVWNRMPLRKTPIDKPLLLLIIIAIASIVINGAPFLRGLINFRTLIRYIAVYYIVVNLNISEAQTRKLVFFIIAIAMLESVFGFFQYFAGVGSFWLPRPTDLEIAGYKKVFNVLIGEVEKGSVIGTFGHTVAMALYLLIAGILILTKVFGQRGLSLTRKVFLLGMFGLIVSVVTLTYSRGSFLCMLIAIPLTLLLFGQKKLLLKFTVLSILSLAVLVQFTDNDVRYVRVKERYVNPIYNMEMIFTGEYLKKTEGSRQWVLREVGKTIAESGTLIGFSPDTETAAKKIVALSSGRLAKMLHYKAFEDVFWVALMAYYGIIGLGLFLLLLLRLYKCSKWVMKRSDKSTFVLVGAATRILIILTVPLTFLIRTFEFRTFGYYFWLLAALTMTEYLRLRREKENGRGKIHQAV
jgi:hypothetical protein